MKEIEREERREAYPLLIISALTLLASIVAAGILVVTL